MDKRLLDEDVVMQLCFVTDDLERSVAWFADLTGKEPAHRGKSAAPEVAQATYQGKPATITFRLALFRFANIDLEFLEPGPEPSTWRDQLNEKGPGFHHFAFRTRDMGQRRDYLTAKGVPMIQHGEFEGQDGRYEYFDSTPQMGAIIELLEWDKDKETHA
ncbi:VOC family protein [Consotaella aegiceratis]|uniref:VOC family protein n=1 Tax=Consotaella aegiceratis TaxID=3097961 RepID=UPI002F41BC0B